VTLAKLTVLFGESDRVDGRLLSDELVRECAERKIHASILLRAAEGFGIKHQLHTERLLTLSEDLPLAVVAIDEDEAIRTLADRVVPLVPGGLVTVERATPIDGAVDTESVKLTIVASRQDPARPLVERLKRAGMDAAVVLLGVDGTVAGHRRRAGFFSTNTDVPSLVVATGPAGAVRAIDGSHFAAIERVVVCKRDGRLLTDPRVDAPDGWWQRISIHSREDLELIRRLRLGQAAGATSLHGIWGFSGEAAPHGDRFFALRRTAPVLTVAVDSPEGVARWWPVVDELTRNGGVVTSELVPDARPIWPA
jgi:PII-like signaling protein